MPAVLISSKDTDCDRQMNRYCELNTLVLYCVLSPCIGVSSLTREGRRQLPFWAISRWTCYHFEITCLNM